MEYKHPMRDLEVIVYQRVEGGSGPNYIAKYKPFHVYPIFFEGDSVEEAKQKAKAFAEEAVAKNEANYQIKRANAEKARAARKKAVDESARSL